MVAQVQICVISRKYSIEERNVFEGEGSMMEGSIQSIEIDTLSWTRPLRQLGFLLDDIVTYILYRYMVIVLSTCIRFPPFII